MSEHGCEKNKLQKRNFKLPQIGQFWTHASQILGSRNDDLVLRKPSWDLNKLGRSNFEEGEVIRLKLSICQNSL